MMRCAIWYHLCNLKNVKGGVSVIEECKWRSVNFRKVAGFSHEGVLLSVKLQVLACNFTKSNTPPWVFLNFLNSTNGTKSRNASHIRFQKEVFQY